MPKVKELQGQIEKLLDEAEEIERGFRGFVGEIHFERTGRRLAPDVERVAARLVGREEPRAYDDYVWNPSDEEFEKQRALSQRYEVWFNTTSVLITAYMPNRWDSFASAYADVKKSLGPPRYHAEKAGDQFDAERVTTSLYRDLASALDPQVHLLRAVPHVVTVRRHQLKQSIGAELVGSEVDHAEQLLNLEGSVPAAINRAAGIIAAIALEKHLKLVADAYNDNVSRQGHGEDRIRYRGEDGIIEMANKLKEREVIEPKELATFKQLNRTRQNCAHVPGNDTKEPSEHEVRFLIQQTRAYVDNIRVQP